MRAVVDTNVVAYLLLGTQGFAQESRRFIGLPDEGIAPAVCEAGVANVVWAAVRQGVMPLDEGGKRLTAAARRCFARASAIAADIPRCPEAPPHRPPSRPTRDPASGFRTRVTCKQV